MTSYRQELPVMFQHCDPAGIVFYPRYFEMMNWVVERFFDEAVGWPFSQMHAVDRRGIPAVSVSAEFRSPARLGDFLDWHLQVQRVGRASATIQLDAFVGDRMVVEGQVSIVHSDLDKMRSLSWTDAVRERLEAHYAENGDHRGK